MVQRDGRAIGRRRLVILQLSDEAPHGIPAADGGTGRQLDAEMVVILPAVDGTHKAGEFSVINYLKVCAEVALLSFFILILQLYRLRNSCLQQELEEIRAINQLLEERQTAESSTASDEQPTACVIRGNTKNAVLEVIPERIVYVESMSNYTDICYLEDDCLRHHSLRITMKQLRESLSPYQYMIPCHRAFLVNLNFIVSLSGRPSTGCSLQLFQVEKPIPVSRSFTKDIHDRLQSE